MPAFEQKNQKINCPYCGELIEVLVDPSEAAQEYVEDCFVCCRPIRGHINKKTCFNILCFPLFVHGVCGILRW